MIIHHYNVNDITKSANVTLLLHASQAAEAPIRQFQISSYFSVANYVYNQYHTQ